jgi:hypothetical protein
MDQELHLQVRHNQRHHGQRLLVVIMLLRLEVGFYSQDKDSLKLGRVFF